MIGYLPGTLLEKLVRGPVPNHVWSVAQTVFNRYLDEMMSILNNIEIRGSPDHVFVERIEEGAIEEGGNVDDFRRSTVAFVGSLLRSGGQRAFWDSNPTMKVAILSYLLEYEPESLILPKIQYKHRTTEDSWEPAW